MSLCKHVLSQSSSKLDVCSGYNQQLERTVLECLRTGKDGCYSVYILGIVRSVPTPCKSQDWKGQSLILIASKDGCYSVYMLVIVRKVPSPCKPKDWKGQLLLRIVGKDGCCSVYI